MNGNVKNTMIDLVVGILVILALMPIATLFPILYLLVPGFIAIIAIRNQKYTGILLLAIMAIIIGFRTDEITGIRMFLLYLPMLLAIQIIYDSKYHYKLNFTERIGLLTLAFLLGFSLMFLTDYIATGENPKNLIIDSVNAIETSYVEVIENSDFNSYQIREFERGIKSATRTVLAIFPSIIIIVSIFAGMINAVFAEKFLYRFNLIAKRNYYHQLKLPDSMPLGVALAFITGILMERMDFGPKGAFIQNMILIISFLSLAQGLAVLSDLLRKRNVRGIFRWILYIFALAIPGLNFVVMAIGLLDSTLDLRKIRGKRPRR